MKILITGGNGFLGRRLAARLLKDGVTGPDGIVSVSELVLVDAAQGPPDSVTHDPRVKQRIGDLTDRIRVPRALRDIDAVFHLAAVVSGQAEADFDLGMRVNLDATRTLLEACRYAGSCPRLIFASSVAVFGGRLLDAVGDDTTPTPQSSYGIQKYIGEQLVADYTRRGFVDGRSIRLPTIVVRPGKPNQAASSFASGIIREPLAGVEAVCPVTLETRLWLLSPDGAVDALHRTLCLPQKKWGDRVALNVPGISVTVAEMVESLRQVAGAEVAKRIRWQTDTNIAAIVASWPGRFVTKRASALGFHADADFDSIVRAHMAQAAK